MSWKVIETKVTGDVKLFCQEGSLQGAEGQREE